MSQLTVDFNGGYPHYEILQGQIDQSQERLENTTDMAKVRIMLPAVSKVNHVQFKYTDPGAAQARILLLNENKSIVADTGDHLVGGGGTFQYSFNTSNVRYVDCQLFHSWDNSVSIDDCVVTFEPMGVASSACEHEECCCEVGCHSCSEPTTKRPISLRTGDKQERVTDLNIATTAGSLDFTRSFRQSKLEDADFPQVMGLGWSHNHNLRLVDDRDPNEMIYVYLPGGGRAHFEKVSTTQYAAKAGGTSIIDIDDNNADENFVLKATDQTFVFDDSGRLRSRHWTNGEVWTYSYADGLLQEVADGYGRKLQLTYIDLGWYADPQLWRVGDQHATGLDGDNPAGRYVEFTYIKEHDDGSEVTTDPQPLLSVVQDVRGQEWTYRYYGSESGEYASDPQANYLVDYQSPAVDSDGDGAADGEITLKHLAYTFSGSDLTGITQSLGKQGADPYLQETEYEFLPGQGKTIETTDGKEITHHFLNDVYMGPQDALGNRGYEFQNGDYRPFAQLDANGNETELTWDGDGKTLTSVTDAKNNETAFEYDGDDRLITSTDAENRKTHYVYDGDHRQPTLILVTDDSAIVQKSDIDIEDADDWTALGSAAKARISPQVDSGQHSRYVNADSGEGIESDALSLVGGKTYAVTARVYRVNGSSGTVRMRLPDALDSSPFTVNSDSQKTDEWETLGATYTPSSSETRKLRFTADGGAAEFYVDTASVTEEQGLVVNGGMEDDSDWSGVNSPTTNQRSSGQVHSGTYSRYVVAAGGAGIEGSQWNMAADRLYHITAYVYPVSGTVRMQVSGTPAFDVLTAGSGAWEPLEALYSPGLDTDDVTLQFLADGGSAEFYVDTVSIQEIRVLDLNGNMEQATTPDGWSDVGAPTNERRPHADTGDYLYRVAASAGDGIQSEAWNMASGKTYVMMARVHPDSGQAKLQLVDGATPANVLATATGETTREWQTLRLVYRPEQATNGVKLRLVADAGSSVFYADTVHVIETTDLLRWQDFRCDPKGRNVEAATVNIDDAAFIQKVTREYHLSGNGGGLLKRTDQHDAQQSGNTVYEEFSYDSAGRVVYTRKGSTFGGCQANRTTYDPAGNVLSTTCIRRLEDADDPYKSPVTAHEYDAMGRLVKTFTYVGTTDEQVSLTLYDAMGRVRRTIANYAVQGNSAPGDWVWREVSGVWAWRLGESDDTVINHSTENNQNSISDTEYNARGLVQLQRDGLGNATYFVYDDAGRLVRTIANYVPQGSTDPADWVWDTDHWEDGNNNAIDHGDNDQNLITETVYDRAGNVVKQIDSLRNTTLTGHDELNRPVKVVRNASNPNYAYYNDLDLSGYSANTDTDRDLISTTEYDALGRAIQTGQLQKKVGTTETWAYSRTVYDSLGRAFRAIANYVEQGDPATDPANWEWVTDHWEDGDSNDIDHGDNDQNLITETVYDEAGHVLYTLDVNRVKTWYVYDGLGRQVKTISNCTYNGSGTAPESDSYVGDLDDPAADSITQTYYDEDGRVQKTKRTLKTNTSGTDLEWLWTLYGYDDQNRQVKVIQNASNPTYDMVSDPDLSGYSASSNSDEDIVSETIYDDQGRVQQTIDTLGRATYTVYDDAGRLVRTIANYVPQGSTDPADWVWDTDHWEDGNNNAIDHGEDDQNIVTETTYDVAGRVQKTIDALRNVTFYGYDKAGRQIKVIRNASDDDYDVDADTSLGSYTGSNPDGDQDRITTTAYDIAGRVQQTTDLVGNVTLFGYDRAGRRVKTIRNASDADYDVDSDADLSGYTGSNPDDDQDYITRASYDKAGRVVSTFDAANIETRVLYDALGRRIRTIANYVAQGSTDPANWVWSETNRRWEYGPADNTAVSHGADNDQNLISDTVYNLRSQVVSTRDTRGTQTGFTYDTAGRRLTITPDAGGNLETVSYTCYDKAGRVLRTIQNWIDDGTNPDEKDGSGDWVFAPVEHGRENDQNLIAEQVYDQASRRTKVTNPAGDQTETSYFRDGQVKTITDPEGTVTLYRYDGLRRRKLVVQGFVDDDYEDPDSWVWEGGMWKDEPAGATIAHGTGDNKDENIIVQAAYNLAGWMTGLRDPNGNLTEYEYDRLGRRTKLTNPLSSEWETAYADVESGGSPTGETRTTLTYPGLATGGSYGVVRDFDRLGRLKEIDYNQASTTPKVTLSYDAAGNRTRMAENDGTEDIRITEYGYDDARRLTSVGFDADGDETVDETVSYEYDVAGNRTKLSLPGDLEVVYRYDAQGRLVGLRDWGGQSTDLMYDGAGRHIATVRHNGLLTQYRHDAAGRLRRLRHMMGGQVRTQFVYDVDGRGNRTQAYEYLAEPTTVVATYDKDHANVSYPQGSWTDNGSFKESTHFGAEAAVEFTGDEIALTFGVGPDHSIFDVYIGESLWRSYDGYAASSGERTVHIHLTESGAYTLEMRNRPEKNLSATPGDTYRVQFRQLQVLNTEYTAQTIQYTYDRLARLLLADYYAGTDLEATPTREYAYTYDRAGNRLSQALALNGGQPTTTTYTYNVANQLVNDGTNTLTYDDNGNLTSDGVNSYTWDRANRLLSMGGVSNQYDGEGHRIQKTVGVDVTKYLLDLQPGLSVALSANKNGDVTRFVHTPVGIHAQEDPNGIWSWAVQDALGSVRLEANNALSVLGMRHLDPFGNPFGAQGTMTLPFIFTGEIRDENGLQDHRARQYSSQLGIFPSLDPFEGTMQRPMSLNGYSWVEGNTPNAVDPSGNQPPCTCEELLGLPGFSRSVLRAIGCLTDTPPSSTPTLSPVQTPIPVPAQTPSPALIMPIGRSEPSCGKYGSFSCEDFENAIYDTIMGANNLYERIIEMVSDGCGFFEDFLGIAKPTGIPLPGLNCVGSWAGHMQQAMQRQNTLDELINCYLRKGNMQWLGGNNPSGLCNVNQDLLERASEWLPGQLPIPDIKPARHGNTTPIPAPLPSKGSILSSVFSVLATPSPNFNTTPPITICEPPYPNGSGCYQPSQEELYPSFLQPLGLLTMATVFVIGLVVIAPEVFAGCATNPQLCLGRAIN